MQFLTALISECQFAQPVSAERMYLHNGTSELHRVSALDKHQNWSTSALFCLNSQAQSKYTVVNLIHTRRKQTCCILLCDEYDNLVSLKVI